MEFPTSLGANDLAILRRIRTLVYSYYLKRTDVDNAWNRAKKLYLDQCGQLFAGDSSGVDSWAGDFRKTACQVSAAFEEVAELSEHLLTYKTLLEELSDTLVRIELQYAHLINVEEELSDLAKLRISLTEIIRD